MSLLNQAMRRLLLLFAFIAVFRLISVAQCEGKPDPNGLSWNYDAGENEKFSLWGFVQDVVTPDLIKDTRRIRLYIRDPRFVVLTKLCGEMRAVDAIYLKALKLADHNLARALVLSMLGTLEHRAIKMKFPLVGTIDLPLTFEEDSLFAARYRNLPSNLYVDTPPEGDRDKLQHFFGSAFVAYASESRDVANTSGNLIEWGEARFIVGGVDDPRDRRANARGARFGHDLLTIRNLLPSDYWNLTIEE